MKKIMCNFFKKNTNNIISYNTTLITGFWLYILSDCILFSSLFLVYYVLYHNTFYSINISYILNKRVLFLETVFLLFSSFFYGLGIIFYIRNNISYCISALFFTIILGIIFLYLELNEFIFLISKGFSWEKSAFLSSYFTLVGTHGIHVLLGIIWILITIINILFNKNTTNTITLSAIYSRLICLGIFWSFLDIIWIFLFSFIYLLGSI